MSEAIHAVIVDHNPANKVKNDSFNRAVLITNIQGLALIQTALEKLDVPEANQNNLKKSILGTIKLNLPDA